MLAHVVDTQALQRWEVTKFAPFADGRMMGKMILTLMKIGVVLIM